MGWKKHIKIIYQKAFKKDQKKQLSFGNAKIEVPLMDLYKWNLERCSRVKSKRIFLIFFFKLNFRRDNEV